jgi:hypothetical protein
VYEIGKEHRDKEVRTFHQCTGADRQTLPGFLRSRQLVLEMLQTAKEDEIPGCGVGRPT